MKNVLVIGAGRSSADLISFLLQNSAGRWKITVADMDVRLAAERIGGSESGIAVGLDASDIESRRALIAGADIVVSMLPAVMHVEVARDCLHAAKHLVTPSYISDEMWELDADARAAGLLFLNEMGVDPGIDHMSAMRIIDRLKSSGAILQSFESFTGGLIAPQFDDNPWNYKITWNPRNVVLAGAGGVARFLEDGRLRYIPYHQLFKRIIPVEIDDHGTFEGYANRDSLKYLKLYGLEDIPTLFRGTLRRSGFCAAWQTLVDLGLTDDSFQIENARELTWRSLTLSFLPAGQGSPEDILQLYTGASETSMSKLTWLGIFDETSLNIDSGTPAQALQKLIEVKWKLGEHDKDQIVMLHRFRYELDGKSHQLDSYLVHEGENQTHTAMSKTVGLPIAIAVKRMLEGKLTLTGVRLPVLPELYNPLLDDPEKVGISFTEKHTILPG